MSRTPFFGVWGHSGTPNGVGRENLIWTCFVTATWQFWTKNDVKSSFLVGLRQNKAQKSRKHVKIFPKAKKLVLVVLTHFDTHYSTQASSRSAWARMHMRQHFVIFASFELQNRPRPPRKAFPLIFMSFVNHFWALFCPRPTRIALFSKFSAKNGHFWSIREILTQKRRKNCIFGRF